MDRISLPNRPELALEFDANNQAELGPCPDCGKNTKRVWGYIYNADAARAAYFVEWTPAHPQRDAVFDLILGKWGEAAGPEDRSAVSVAFRVLDTGAFVHGAGCLPSSHRIESVSVHRVGPEYAGWDGNRGVGI